jgi:hypothetical protein
MAMYTYLKQLELSMEERKLGLKTKEENSRTARKREKLMDSEDTQILTILFLSIRLL